MKRFLFVPCCIIFFGFQFNEPFAKARNLRWDPDEATRIGTKYGTLYCSLREEGYTRGEIAKKAYKQMSKELEKSDHPYVKKAFDETLSKCEYWEDF